MGRRRNQDPSCFQLGSCPSCAGSSRMFVSLSVSHPQSPPPPDKEKDSWHQTTESASSAQRCCLWIASLLWLVRSPEVGSFAASWFCQKWGTPIGWGGSCAPQDSGRDVRLCARSWEEAAFVSAPNCLYDLLPHQHRLTAKPSLIQHQRQRQGRPLWSQGAELRVCVRCWWPSNWTLPVGWQASFLHLFLAVSRRWPAQVHVHVLWLHCGSGCGSCMRSPSGGVRISVCARWTISDELEWAQWGRTLPGRQLNRSDPKSHSALPPEKTKTCPTHIMQL